MSVLSKFKEIFKSPYSNSAAMELYVTIVQQARLPIFYTEYDVGDTIDGRFDLVALHTFLVLRTLRRDDEMTKKLSQDIFDVMFADMDQNLRELSIGDTGVAKRVMKMAERFYGRIAAYDLALDMEDPSQQHEELCKVIIRNIYRNTPVSSNNVKAMAEYVVTQMKELEQQSINSLLEGTIDFASPGYETRDSG